MDLTNSKYKQVIKVNEFTYSKTEMNIALFLMWLFGLLTGILLS